jgi:beta-lactam-binding protein with PASTA domain
MVAAPSIFRSPRFVSSLGQASAPVIVPDVRGVTRQEAEREIESGSLMLGGQWARYGPMESMGLVISQDPPPGTEVPRGTPVNVFWNAGPLYREYHPEELVMIPAAEAEELLADWQLYSAGRSRVPSPTVPEGYVIAVSPWRPESLSVRRPVRLLVSTGWAGVPRLAGMRPASAESVLAADGALLAVLGDSSVADPGADGRIVWQHPLPGADISAGDTVSVKVGSAPGSGWGQW